MKKTDLNSFETSVDPDQLASEDPHCFPNNVQV